MGFPGLAHGEHWGAPLRLFAFPANINDMTNAPVRSLGEEIRRLREGLELPLRGLAIKLEISAAHMSDIEHGKRFPSDDLLGKIATALKTDVGTLKRFDARIDPDVRRWAEGHPAVGAMLRILRDSGADPDKVAKQVIDDLKNDKGGTA